MGKYNIPQKAWSRATNALLWYMEQREELAALTGTGLSQRDGYRDPTASAAIANTEDVRIRMLVADIQAVTKALKLLRPEEVDVIRLRYFGAQHGNVRTPCPYIYMPECGYGTDAMKWISKKTIYCVAYYLGEITADQMPRRIIKLMS